MSGGDDRSVSGLASALQQLGAAVGHAPPEDQQLEIFEPDIPTLTGERPRSGPKGGRPKGAMNRSTKEWVDYLLQRYRSPLVTLLELTTMTPKQIAEKLELYEHVIVGNSDGHPVYARQLATGEAFKRQIEAAVAALPYIHQKLPLAIETTTGEKGGMLIIGDLNVTANFDGTPSFLSDDEPAKAKLIDLAATDIAATSTDAAP